MPVLLSAGNLPPQMIHCIRPPTPTEVSIVHFVPEPPLLSLLMFELITVVGIKLLQMWPQLYENPVMQI